MVMNIIVKPDTLLQDGNLQYNTHFLDTKENNIMTGEFTKLIFTNEDMSLNGLYIQSNVRITTPLHRTTDIRQKQTVLFDRSHSHNIVIVKSIIDIERKLLDLYMNYRHCKKRPKYILHPQLHNGSIQLYSDSSCLNCPKIIVLKISGIWETDIAYGVTYKFIEM
jgi:hypothetical protein